MAASANTARSAAACWIYAKAVIKVYTSVAAVAVRVNYMYCVLDPGKPERGQQRLMEAVCTPTTTAHTKSSCADRYDRRNHRWLNRSSDTSSAA